MILAHKYKTLWYGVVKFNNVFVVNVSRFLLLPADGWTDCLSY